MPRCVRPVRPLFELEALIPGSTVFSDVTIEVDHFPHSICDKPSTVTYFQVCMLQKLYIYPSTSSAYMHGYDAAQACVALFFFFCEGANGTAAIAMVSTCMMSLLITPRNIV